MAYYLNIFSPNTYETFSKSGQNVSGFRDNQTTVAKRIKPGDKFICYLTKVSRWIGVLEVLSTSYEDSTPLFYEEDDPFIVRFKVRPVVWLEKQKAIPIKENSVWEQLSFTRGHEKNSSGWTGRFRSSLTRFDEQDGKFLEKSLLNQMNQEIIYPVDERDFSKWVTQSVRGLKKLVKVSVPEDHLEETNDTNLPVRESIKIQAELAKIGEKMGFKIWLPKNDRQNVLSEWHPEHDSLLETLPLNYDEVTLRTIEQIDVIWLRRRSIIRAFEIEHTTAIYSGILRMADLLALQPNMDIKLHIVAPTERRDKVFHELQRPVFALLEKGQLSELCTFISYDSVYELAHEKHLSHMSDSVLESFEEVVE